MTVLPPPQASARPRVRMWQIALGAFLAAPLGYLLVARTEKQQERSAAHPPSTAVAPPGHDTFLERGLQHYRNRQFHESILATQKAIEFDPRSAVAYNNLCSAYAELGMWDEAIEAGRTALSLKPDFPLARNNLDWALREKARSSATQSPKTR